MSYDTVGKVRASVVLEYQKLLLLHIILGGVG